MKRISGPDEDWMRKAKNTAEYLDDLRKFPETYIGGDGLRHLVPKPIKYYSEDDLIPFDMFHED